MAHREARMRVLFLCAYVCRGRNVGVYAVCVYSCVAFVGTHMTWSVGIHASRCVCTQVPVWGYV